MQSFAVGSVFGALERVSAQFRFFPGTWKMLKLYFITAFGSVKCEEVSNTDLSLSLKGIVRACDLSALHRFSQVSSC